MSDRVLETLVLHAYDAIHWVDAGSATEPDRMRLVESPLVVELDDMPADLRLLTRWGRTVFWRTGDALVVDGRPSEAQLARPEAPAIMLNGVVTDPTGRFNERRFSVTLGDQAPRVLALYPALRAIRLGRTGGLSGSVRLDSHPHGLAWAVLTLELSDVLGASAHCSVQAGPSGDFMMPLPMLQLIAHDDEVVGRLSVRANPDATPDEPIDPGVFEPMLLGSPQADDVFSDSIELTLRPGEIASIRSSGRGYLALQVV
jgi:hypothetical protein